MNISKINKQQITTIWITKRIITELRNMINKIIKIIIIMNNLPLLFHQITNNNIK